MVANWVEKMKSKERKEMDLRILELRTKERYHLLLEVAWEG